MKRASQLGEARGKGSHGGGSAARHRERGRAQAERRKSLRHARGLLRPGRHPSLPIHRLRGKQPPGPSRRALAAAALAEAKAQAAAARAATAEANARAGAADAARAEAVELAAEIGQVARKASQWAWAEARRSGRIVPLVALI
jgi:hypothetical protein